MSDDVSKKDKLRRTGWTMLIRWLALLILLTTVDCCYLFHSGKYTINNQININKHNSAFKHPAKADHVSPQSNAAFKCREIVGFLFYSIYLNFLT